VDDDLPPATFVDKTRKGLSDFSSEVRYAALIALFLLVYFLTIRPFQKRVLATHAPAPALADSGTFAQAELPPAPESPAILTQRSMAAKKQLADFVRTDPGNSVAAVRTWLQEETQ
jgi:flagellar biosynthesis/type III secretory pathway M-ring protein FliF/YscJ